MSKSSKAVIEWRKRTKARIVESMGGKCSICGYAKHHEVLELHHLEPEKKNFSFASVRANPKAWQTIVEELKKCVLLCSNCHKEVEAGYAVIEIKQYFIDSYKDPTFFIRTETKTNQYAHFGKKNYKERLCISCGEKFSPTAGNQRTCNSICKIKNSQVA
jgi:hypothetical protein